MRVLFEDDLKRRVVTANIVAGIMGVLLGLSVLIAQVKISGLQAANTDLAAVALSHCTAVRLGDLAWMTMVDGEERCVKTVALPSREMYPKPLVKPKVRL